MVLPADMENIIEMADRTADPATFNAEAFVEKFKNGYTMNSERDVLASVVNGHHGAVAVPAAAAVESAVELFDEPAPVIFTAATAPVQPLCALQENTLPMPKPASHGSAAAATSVVPSAPAATSLGDNVELF